MCVGGYYYEEMGICPWRVEGVRGGREREKERSGDSCCKEALRDEAFAFCFLGRW